MKYFYLIPRGGLTDCLIQIGRAIRYCKLSKRVLILDFFNGGSYKCDLLEYFSIETSVKIISNKELIKKELEGKFIEFSWKTKIDSSFLLDEGVRIYRKKGRQKNRWKVHSKRLGVRATVNGSRTLFDESKFLNVNISSFDTSFKNFFLSFAVFKKILLSEEIKKNCIEKKRKIKGKYLCIQVRHSDYKCDYESLYKDNKELIHSYRKIYIATDNKKVVNFFKEKGLDVYCFTRFPQRRYDICHRNLHSSSKVPAEYKIQDLFVDIFLAISADKLLSNSKGGFIKLLRVIRARRSIILPKFE